MCVIMLLRPLSRYAEKELLIYDKEIEPLITANTLCKRFKSSLAIFNYKAKAQVKKNSILAYFTQWNFQN